MARVIVRPRIVLACLAILSGGLLLLRPLSAAAASLSPKDVKILAKALGFLNPPPPGGVIAVVYAGADAGSRTDAEAIAGEFGGGVQAGGSTVTAKAVDLAALGEGGGYVAIIAANGVAGDAAMTAAKAHKIPCITASAALVRGGQCIMAVGSDPKVDITVNRAAAEAAGISFASAFQMLIHEI